MKIKSNKDILNCKIPISNKLYIGIDQSLVCTSISEYQSNNLHFYRLKPLYMGVSRLSEIYDTFSKLLDEFIATHGEIHGAAIEGYAYSATGAKFNLGELGGVLRLALYKKGVKTIEVPPTYLKKYLTGKGTSAKNQMIKEAYKKFEVDLDDDNDCDAFALSMLCKEYFESEFHLLKSYRTEPHKQCRQIIGDHPMRLGTKEYFSGMPNVTVAEYEKQRKAKKKELENE